MRAGWTFKEMHLIVGGLGIGVLFKVCAVCIHFM